MAAESKSTRNHDEIRRWAEARGGRPAQVKGTGGKHGAGLLRIDFQEPDHELESISWEEFFAKFDEKELVFIYQEHTKDGGLSRFNKFVSEESEEERAAA